MKKCELPSAITDITMYEYQPKSIGKASGYTISILENLSDAKTNGSESILAHDLSLTHRRQLL